MSTGLLCEKFVWSSLACDVFTRHPVPPPRRDDHPRNRWGERGQNDMIYRIPISTIAPRSSRDPVASFRLFIFFNRRWWSDRRSSAYVRFRESGRHRTMTPAGKIINGENNKIKEKKNDEQTSSCPGTIWRLVVSAYCSVPACCTYTRSNVTHTHTMLNYVGRVAHAASVAREKSANATEGGR